MKELLMLMKARRNDLLDDVSRLNRAIHDMTISSIGLTGGGSATGPVPVKKRTISPAGRRNMRLAQQKRWKAVAKAR